MIIRASGHARACCLLFMQGHNFHISFGFLILVEHTTCVHLVFVPLVLDRLLRNNNSMHKLSLCVRMQEQKQPRVKWSSSWAQSERDIYIQKEESTSSTVFLIDLFTPSTPVVVHKMLFKTNPELLGLVWLLGIKHGLVTTINMKQVLIWERSPPRKTKVSQMNTNLANEAGKVWMNMVAWCNLANWRAPFAFHVSCVAKSDNSFQSKWLAFEQCFFF